VQRLVAKTARNLAGEMAARAEKSRTMTSRHNTVEALARDPVGHGGSRLGWWPGTLTDEDVEARASKYGAQR